MLQRRNWGTWRHPRGRGQGTRDHAVDISLAVSRGAHTQHLRGERTRALRRPAQPPPVDRHRQHPVALTLSPHPPSAGRRSGSKSDRNSNGAEHSGAAASRLMRSGRRRPVRGDLETANPPHCKSCQRANTASPPAARPGRQVDCFMNEGGSLTAGRRRAAIRTGREPGRQAPGARIGCIDGQQESRSSITADAGIGRGSMIISGPMSTKWQRAAEGAERSPVPM